MIVFLDGERLEAALIQMAGADGAVVRVPTHGVRVRQPAKKVGQVAIALGPEDEVPVIGHEAVAENADRELGVGFIDNAQERLVVAVLLEERQPGDGSIQGVVDVAARRMASSSWHGVQHDRRSVAGQEKRAASPLIFL